MKSLCIAAVALLLTIVAFPQAEPLSDAAATIWNPAGLGEPLLESPGDRTPTTVLVAPHLTVDRRDAALGFAGGGVASRGDVAGALAGTVPLRRAVASGGFGVAADDGGSIGRIVASVARPLGSRLAAGAGGTISFAAGSAARGLGAGVDLGVRYRLGGRGDVSRVAIHGALLGIGSSATRAGGSAVAPPFTAMVGLRGRVLEAEQIAIDAAGSIQLESLRALRTAAAVRLSIGPRLAVSLGGDLRFADGGARFWPGISIGARFRPVGDGGTRGGLAVRPDVAGGALLAGDVVTSFPASDPQPPDLQVGLRSPEQRDPVVFGPAADGALPMDWRTALQPVAPIRLGGRAQPQLAVTIAGVDDRAIGAVSAELRAPDGTIVREWVFQPVGDPVISGAPADRLSSDLARRELESSIVWGPVDETVDGRYRLGVWATDAAGNRTDAADIPVLIDRTPPDVSVVLETSGESGRRTAPAEQTVVVGSGTSVFATARYGDAEVVRIHVRDQAGRAVRSLDALPEGQGTAVTAEWAGEGDDGQPVPEGVYRVVVSAADEFGNRSRAESGDIEVRRRRPRFDLSLDGTVLPAEGGLTAGVALEPIAGLRQWRIALVPEAGGAPVRDWSGIDLPPSTIRLDDDTFPRDGRYRLVGEARYAGGVVVNDQTAPVLVDRVPPSVTIGLSDIVIGPQDDRELVVFIEHDDTAEVGRVLVGRRGDEPVVIASVSPLPDTIEWPTVLPDGTFAPAGVYQIWVEAEDAAGNAVRSAVREFELVERIDGAAIAAQVDVFSPNGDGVRDDVVFALRGPGEGPGDFSIVARQGSRERRFAGQLPVPSRVPWDGRDQAGRPFPDGPVTVELTVEAPDRGTSQARTTVAIDTRPPVVELDRPGAEFVSPDGDGENDELILRLSTQPDAEVVLELTDGDTVLRRSELDTRGVLRLPVVGADGEVLPDGSYGVRAIARDRAGNRAVSERISFTVDTRPVSGFVRVSAGAISPNGDGDADQVVLTPVLSDPEGLVSWAFEMIPADEPSTPGRDAVRLAAGSTVAPEAVTWPATASEVQGIPDGEYVARLTASYRHGPQLEVASPPVLIDRSPPEVDVRVRPQPFSPDNDGRDDVVSLETSVTADSTIRYWILEVFDPTGAFFYDVGDRGSVPEVIRWDGLARNGERVVSAESYPYRLEVADEVGNVTVVEGSLDVDVLVERYRSGYRIQIPSITFPPNSAELVVSSEDARGAQNDAVLDRLVEILERFPEYEIVVEGHAVNLTGTQAEEERELLPLSQARAESVVEELIERGVAGRLLSARGRGGTIPVVPHEDTQNRWKNRRVEFILQR